MFSSYIDRQKSRIGSSEKSQKVHSANWKEEVQFRKELECLNKQERQRVSRISIDQRLAVNRFQNKLSKSVLIAKSHEKAICDLDDKRSKMETALQDQPDLYQHMRTIRCLNAFPKPPVPKFNKRRSKSCEPPKKIQNTKTDDTEKLDKPPDVKNEPEKDLMPRPMTALEKRNRLWERQLDSVTQRINRARSAPTKTSFYKVPEFSQSLETVIKPGKSTRTLPPKQRGMTYAIDMDVYRYLREKEITRQREAVKAFLMSVEPLELIPWTPFDEYNEPHSEAIYLTGNNTNEGENTTQQEESARRTSQTRQSNLTDYKPDNRRLSIAANRQPTKAWT